MMFYAIGSEIILKFANKTLKNIEPIMPTNKGALIRRQVIDRCLSGHRFYSVA